MRCDRQREALCLRRLTGISPAGTDTSFTDDMFNRRLSKGGSGGVTTQYVYDGGNEVQEQNSKGAVSANMLNGLGLDDRFTRTAIASGTTSAFLVDGLGSTLGLAYTGAVKTDYAYQPYGTASVSGTSNTNTYEYTGRELDGSGLQYNRNRYYNPAWGRFVSEDPIGFAGGPNVYAYVGNDPVNFTDPLGTGPLGAAIGGWVGGAGAGALGIESGPLDALAVAAGRYGGRVAGSAIEDALRNVFKGNCPTGKCPPCNPPAGTIRYRFDQVPPSKPHFPFPGDHYHIYTMNQDPVSCRCSWSKTTTDQPPPPGAQPF